MTSTSTRSADRVEAFLVAIDQFEPPNLGRHEDNFRVFARCVSRSIDGRYLSRHPADELLPDLEHLFSTSLVRSPDEVKVTVTLTPSPSGQRGVLTTCVPDQLFIYSVVRMALDHLDVRRGRSFATVIPIQRDAVGEIHRLGTTDQQRESFIWTEIEARDLADRAAEIEAYVHSRLEAIRGVVADFSAMRASMEGLAGDFERLARSRHDHRAHYENNARLLRWLLSEHFVFLGTQLLPFDGATPPDFAANLGVGRFDDERGIRLENAESAVLEAGGIPPFLWIRKSHNESWVYRPGHLDHLLVQCFDRDGSPAGLLVVEGIFSYQALAEPRTTVPLLDRTLSELFAQMGAEKGSHRYRTIRNAFNSLPLEFLFTLQLEDIAELVTQVVDVDVENRLQLHLTTDPLQDTAFVFVALPRTHYSDELRADIRRHLREVFRARAIDDGVYAGNAESVTFHYFITGASSLDARATEQLKVDIDALASPWSDRLLVALQDKHPGELARELHTEYADALPPRYREETSIARAVADVEILRTLNEAHPFDCDVYAEKVDRHLGITRIRMFSLNPMLLSDVLPVLDNFGLVVMDQFPTRIQLPNGQERLLATFRISGVQDLKVDLLTRRNRLRGAIRAVVTGAMKNDPLNRLLLHADIRWNRVSLVRSFHHYARQVGLPYAAGTVQESLIRNGDVVRALTEYFKARFDPNIQGHSDTLDDTRRALIQRTEDSAVTLLETVDDLVSDTILRTVYNLMQATVRTNFYARDPFKIHHIVLKIDPSLVNTMPEPRPFREIYVHHPKMAGLHLRGGPVARGGLRWSDRLLDFRTEVLGLMATQNLKNVVIVPRGAKGAFVVAYPPADPAALRDAGDEAYRLFIRGILDVTDNLVNGEIVKPKGVICYDQDDHYLVVAADKGTAHQSDNANAIAEDRNFWLGDAFASGGSKGYDHKKVGITARGAWTCVRRHFREMGLDPEKDVVRVAGIGDMSGDVFGNGMLRSKTLQLVAAFDHRHIFIDPNPDPAASYKARLELFNKGRSTWLDYPQKVMSKGGGVYPRGAKSIDLSPEAKAMLGVSSSSLSGPELVQAVLRAKVDLLWNGGIGTYVRATHETNIEVGDPSTDLVRVSSDEVRAKVIGEGGNLGLTAAARVELSQRGLRLNTDAVDNSAGVDMSDHEVNLKILMQGLREQGKMDPDKRDALMEAATEEVSEQCLDNNWVQSRTISLDVLRSTRDMARFQRAIDFLSQRVPFKRQAMVLPTDRVMIERSEAGKGLCRPELAALVANAKLDLRQELVHCKSFPLERLKTELVSYFPPSIRDKFPEAIENHALGISIARTVLVNKVIGDAGATWLAETIAMTGCSTNDAILAYFEASTLLHARQLKDTVNNIEAGITSEVEYDIRLIIEDAIEEVANWVLGQPASVPQAFHPAFAEAFAALPTLTHVEDNVLGERGANVDNELCRSLGILEQIDDVLDIATLMVRTGETVARAGAALYRVGEGTNILRLVDQALQTRSTDSLDRPARFALRRKMRGKMVHLAEHLLRAETDLEHISATTQEWMEALSHELNPLARGSCSVADLVMAVEHLDRQVTHIHNNGDDHNGDEAVGGSGPDSATTAA